MAEQPKVHSSPSALLHPLATVATAQTIGGGFIPLFQSLMSPKEETGHLRLNLDALSPSTQTTTSAPPAIDRIQAVNSDHCYPKINAFVPSLRNCGPLPSLTLFGEIQDGQTPLSGGASTTHHRPSSQTSEREEEEDDIDVVSVNEEATLSYDDAKVKTAMLECEKHVNMVKLISAKMEKRSVCTQKEHLLGSCDHVVLRLVQGCLPGHYYTGK